MTRRSMHTTAAAWLLALAVVAALVPALPSDAQVSVLDDNPWLERGPLNIAHRGAAFDAPENTLYAYRTALANGAHMLEMDVYETADGELVAIHDATVDRTTNGSGAIADLTLEEIQALDAAYWHVDDRGAVRDEPDDAYRFRGIATGDRPVPDDLAAAGITPEDFRIPTVRQVLETFPGIWKVIELKPNPEAVGPFEVQLAELLQEFGRSDDVIVASFIDVHLEVFKLVAPEIHTSYPLGQAAAHWASSQGPLPGAPNRHVALQVPTDLEVIPVVDEQFVADAHAMNLAVHVWTINDCPTMVDLLEIGVDGIMTDRSILLAALLDQPEGQWDCEAAEAAAAQPAPAAPSPADDPDPAPDNTHALPATGGGALVVVGTLGLALALGLRERRWTRPATR
jgi:glycerophosphoryl diester phosphodiesterase